jgi:haloacid dehalogenase-like hydrolase
MGTNENSDWHALVDFDGTIAPDDPTDRLLERFAAPTWREIEAAWQSGKISSQECLSRQVALMRVTPAALEQQIDAVKVDPGFARFLEFCRQRGGEVTIVSDGFDRVHQCSWGKSPSRCQARPGYWRLASTREGSKMDQIIFRSVTSCRRICP